VGAASRICEEIGVPLARVVEAALPRYVELARAALGAERFDALLAEGKAMSQDAAVAYARDAAAPLEHADGTRDAGSEGRGEGETRRQEARSAASPRPRVSASAPRRGGLLLPARLVDGLALEQLAPPRLVI